MNKEKFVHNVVYKKYYDKSKIPKKIYRFISFNKNDEQLYKQKLKTFINN